DYIAGLVEGEGCFCLAVAKRDTKHGMKIAIIPTFALYMTDKPLVERLHASMKAYGIPVRMQERRKATAQGQLGVEARGMERVRTTCEVLVPYLHGNKKQAAGLVLTFINSRLAKPMGVSFTEEEISMIETLRATNGNQRGRKTPIGILRDY